MTTAHHPSIQVPLFNYLLTFAICALCLALGAYISLITLTVAHVARENNYSTAISSDTNAVSALEQNYMAMEAGLTLQYAASLGLAEPTNTLFVSQDPSSVAFSSGTN